jgi:hypothetical protein
VSEQVSVPIWLIVIVSAGWVALVAAAFLFGRADWRSALDIACDSDTAARIAAIKENAARVIRRAVVAHTMEQAALAGASLALKPAVRPRPRVPIQAVIEHVDYINPATSTVPWVAANTKPSAVILDEPPVPDEERPVPAGDDEPKSGRHRAPDWLLEDDTRQILSAAGARALREAGR